MWQEDKSKVLLLLFVYIIIPILLEQPTCRCHVVMTSRWGYRKWGLIYPNHALIELVKFPYRMTMGWQGSGFCIKITWLALSAWSSAVMLCDVESSLVVLCDSAPTTCRDEDCEHELPAYPESSIFNTTEMKLRRCHMHYVIMIFSPGFCVNSQLVDSAMIFKQKQNTSQISS